jgi:hypothetical protein
MFDWWVHSVAGLWTRIALGAVAFAALALMDLRKRGREATRWREYGVLLACTLAAMAYGALNDQVTSAISWEYFYYGKGLYEKLGDRLPPDAVRLHLAAAVVGIQATWTAGLIIGVALLLANNPSGRRSRASEHGPQAGRLNGLPSLPARALLRRVPLVLVLTVLISVAGGVAGYFGLPARFSEDFAEMLRRDEMRPRRFMAVYGVHMGGYVGGAVATIAGVISVRRERRRGKRHEP